MNKRITTILIIALALVMILGFAGNAVSIDKPRDGAGTFKDRIPNGPLHGEITKKGVALYHDLI